MPTLHFGVIDIPYADANYRAAPKGRRIGQAKRGKATAPLAPSNHQTTGYVAEILEAKYHVMETFVDLNENLIAGMLEQSVAGALQNLVAGAPATIGFTAQGEADIENRFRQFLTLREMDGAVNGVPTRAALDGVSHRFLHPYAKRASRPSFVDTGLYEANLHVWTTE